MTKKRPSLDTQAAAGLFTKTERLTQPGPQTESDDPVKPLGVGLRLSERARLDEIAHELGVARHALLLYAVRDFIRRYEAGERPKTKTVKTLDS